MIQRRWVPRLACAWARCASSSSSSVSARCCPASAARRFASAASSALRVSISSMLIFACSVAVARDSASARSAASASLLRSASTRACSAAAALVSAFSRCRAVLIASWSAWARARAPRRRSSSNAARWRAASSAAASAAASAPAWRRSASSAAMRDCSSAEAADSAPARSFACAWRRSSASMRSRSIASARASACSRSRASTAAPASPRGRLGGVAPIRLGCLALARRLDRRRFRRRERLCALVQAVFGLGVLLRGRGEGLFRGDARLRFGKRPGFHFLAFAGRLCDVPLAFRPRMSAAAQLGVNPLALARKPRRLGLDMGTHVGGVFRRVLRRRLLLRRLERLGLGLRALARLLLGRELERAALFGERGCALFRFDAAVRLSQRARFRRLALLRHLDGGRLGIGTRLRAPRGMAVLPFALAHRGHGIALGGDPFLGRDARLLLGVGPRPGELGGIRLQLAALFGLLLGLLLGLSPRLLLLEVRALHVAAALGHAPGFGFRRDARFPLALEPVLPGLALAHRLERPLLGLQPLARRAPRQVFGRRALAHRRGRLHLRLGTFARELRGFLLLLAAALGERRGLLLRLLARFRLGSRLRLGALALGDDARRLRLGLGARGGDAPQLDFRRLALARHVQPALFLAELCLHGLAGAAFGLDAVARRRMALALRVLQLVEEFAHLLLFALALSAAAAPRAGEKSRLIRSPSESE